MPTSNTTIDDKFGLSAEERDLIVSNCNAAFQQWSQYLIGSASIEIVVNAFADLGQNLASARSTTTAFTGIHSGKNLFAPGAAYEILSNRDPNGNISDIEINLDMGDVRNGRIVFDRTPYDNLPESNLSQFDAVTIFTHEIGHGLFMNGWHTDPNFASLTYLGPFDRYVAPFHGGEAFFGPNAVKVNGGPVLLQNGSHLAAANDQMNPFAPFGIRLRPSELDLAILSDCNLPTVFNDLLTVDMAGGRIDAGSGLDRVQFTSTLFQARVSRDVNQNLLVDFNSIGLQSTNYILQNVERLQFTDTTLAFDLNAQQAYRLYQASFARTPDIGGLSYWIDALDDGLGLRGAARGFIASSEFLAAYGTSAKPDEYISKFYMNVLGRAGEAGGVAFWSGELNRGVSLADILVGFSESGENVARLAPLIGQGIMVDSGAFV